MTPANRTRALRLLAAGALMLVAGSALASSGGAPNGLTGAPGESTCTNCHSTFPLNSGAGSLALGGFPESYVAGQTYDLTVTVSDPDASRWGFELTIIEDGGATAPSVGQITLTDSGTSTGATALRTYLKQNASGTANGTTGAKSWTFQWTAPAAGTGAVRAYVAGNAANGNFSTSGDRIYNASFAAAEDSNVPVFDTPGALALRGAAPNPFNPRTEIRFDLPRDAHVRVTVLTVDGRRVATLADRSFAAGPHAVAWDGRDHAGTGMGSGTYLYVVEAGGERRLGRMTLLK